MTLALGYVALLLRGVDRVELEHICVVLLLPVLFSVFLFGGEGGVYVC